MIPLRTFMRKLRLYSDPLTGHVLVTVIFNGCAQAYVLTSPDEAVFGTARINHRVYNINLEKTFKRKNQKYYKKVSEKARCS